MKEQIRKFETRLIEQKLAEDRERTVVCGRDDVVVRSGNFGGKLVDNLLNSLDILGLVCFVPHPLYRRIIEYMAGSASILLPEDCETTTFLHDIPVIDDFEPGLAVKALARRRGAVSRNGTVIARGTITIEEAFIGASSVIHALFIKYFLDYWHRLRTGTLTYQDRLHLKDVVARLPAVPEMDESLEAGPFEAESIILREISRAGRAVVKAGLVDSFFGNVSYTADGICYITQTSSSLDELDGAIVPVPVNGSSSVGLTASSELGAHMGIAEKTGCRAILHGHPKFSVIASMMCEYDGLCRHNCYRECPEKREVCRVPVVCGEIGAGGLAKTLPGRVRAGEGTIVYGHGVFTTGMADFRRPFAKMVEIERMARAFTLKRLDRA